MYFREIERLAKVAAAHVRQELHSAIRSLGDPVLARVTVERLRIKNAASLKRKARERGWVLKDAAAKASDLVGARVVCHNLQDVSRIADWLERHLSERDIEVTRQDYVARPKRGYRAVHLNMRVPVQVGRNKMSVGCEVQIRSLLQDAWARLSRAELYATDVGVRASLVRRMNSLSRLLSRADRIADDIRNEISKPVPGRRGKPGAPPSRATLAFLFQRAFGSEPAGYVIEAALSDLRQVPIRLDAVDTALRDKRLRKNLVGAYQRHAKWAPGAEEYFRWVLRALTQGIRSATTEARRAGRAAWDEVDAIYRSEMSSSLPADWSDLVDAIDNAPKDGDLDSELTHWADFFGVLDHCAVCGCELVPADSFAEAVVDHYALDGDEADQASEAVERALWSSGIETDSSLCSYCSNAMSRDD